MGRKGSTASASFFTSNFTREKGTFANIFEWFIFGKMPLLQSGPFFWVSLSKSFDLQETLVMGVFEVPEFEFSIKIEVAPFLLNLGTLFARNLRIARERWVGLALRRLHRFSRPILRTKSAHLRTFLKRSNLGKCPYYRVRAFFWSIYWIRSICRKLRLWRFSMSRNSNLPSKLRWHNYGWSWYPFLQEIWA